MAARNDRTTSIVAVDRYWLLEKLGQRRRLFWLIDQRTFECKWATLERLASHKPKEQNKVELFYFLAASWLPHALAAQKSKR
jgi:hypothetical protein